MRANSLTNLGVALDYNVVSDYDKVLVVAGLAEEIEALAPHANEIATLVASLPDVLTVQEASELVNNLTVKVTTLPEGSTATSELVGTEIRLGIPAGTQGAQGIQGPKGDTGDHVHHISYQRSKDPMGNEVGPTEPGRPGYDDIYAMWPSQEELPEMFIGEFVTHNGLNILTAEEQAKLDSVEFGATRDQVASEVAYDNTISGLLSEDIQNSIDELSATKLNLIEKGQPNGVASLDSNGLVPSTQLPSYVDDVIEVDTKVDLPTTGEKDKIYIVVTDETSNGDTSTYRWTGTVYAMVSNTLTAADIKSLYESNTNTNEYTDAERIKLADTEITSQLEDRDTANRDRANHTGTQSIDTVTETLGSKVMTAEERVRLDAGVVLTTTATTVTTAINELASVKVDKIVGSSLVPDTKVSLYDSHIIDTANPHVVTKAQVGLSNADNTSDNIKNVLSATKWSTARTITLSGDVSGSVSVDGSANITMTTTVQPNSVALGTDTTGNYMVNVTAGSGISVLHTQGEGSTATITNSKPNVTTDITTTHTSTNVVVNSSDGTDGTINAATQTLAGVMSADDKTKLNGIESGATGDQTANEILTLLKTVDGSGSELDADLLDGQEGAYYLNASNINTGTIDDDRLPDTITSSTTGNAATATKLNTARTINGVSFDGSANITVVDSTKAPLASPTFTGTPTAPTAASTVSSTQLATTAFAIPRVTGVDNAIVRFDGTTGEVQNSGVIVEDNGNISIPGPQLNFYGFTALHDSIEFVQRVAGKGFTWYVNGGTKDAMTLDASGNLLLTGGGSIGCGTGAGGTVTQLTSKSTAVTLNKPSGRITMNNSAFAAGASVFFAVNNNLVTTSDHIVLTMGGGTANTNYTLFPTFSYSDGIFYVMVKNISTGSLSEALVINFTVIKGATS